MAVSAELLEATVSIIADYREGEIARPDVAHVKKWLSQFDENVRESLLTELNHVLGKTYVSKSAIEKFLAMLVTGRNVVGENPQDFWRNSNFLDVQKRGQSQADFLKLFAVPLKEKTGLELAQCGAQPACYIYLDDGIFTGMTLIQSSTDWVKADAPQNATLHVIVIAGHVGGKHYAETKLQEVAKAAGKTITFRWWALLALEDRRANTNTSDVLRPTSIPNDTRTQAYAKSLKFPPVLRAAGNVGEKQIFSSEAGRNLLEQQLLMKGTYIREVAPRLPKYARPLGDMVLETLGFGSTFVTYRNCPNNTPLAFWAGDPWYPLFPRKTN
jgi:hypothetical protein